MQRTQRSRAAARRAGGQASLRRGPGRRRRTATILRTRAGRGVASSSCGCETPLQLPEVCSGDQDQRWTVQVGGSEAIGYGQAGVPRLSLGWCTPLAKHPEAAVCLSPFFYQPAWSFAASETQWCAPRTAADDVEELEDRSRAREDRPSIRTRDGTALLQHKRSTPEAAFGHRGSTLGSGEWLAGGKDTLAIETDTS